MEEDEGQTQLSVHVPKTGDPTKWPKKGEEEYQAVPPLRCTCRRVVPPQHQGAQGQRVAMGRDGEAGADEEAQWQRHGEANEIPLGDPTDDSERMYRLDE